MGEKTYLSLAEIDKANEEIRKYKARAHAFVAFGWLSMILSFGAAILGIILGLITQNEAILITFLLFAIPLFVLSIALWIIKSALYSGKINARKKAIKESVERQRMINLYKDHLE